MDLPTKSAESESLAQYLSKVESGPRKLVKLEVDFIPFIFLDYLYVLHC